jgi:hypothetical protein
MNPCAPHNQCNINEFEAPTKVMLHHQPVSLILNLSEFLQGSDIFNKNCMETVD